MKGGRTVESLTCPYCGSDRRFGKACQCCPYGEPSAFELVIAEIRLSTQAAPERQRPVPGDFLSVRHIADRWDCGLTTVYRQIQAMEAAGLLKPFYPGAKKKSDRRIALESIEAWERLNGAAKHESRAALAKLRKGAGKKKPDVPQDARLDRLREFVDRL
jgi:transposase